MNCGMNSSMAQAKKVEPQKTGAVIRALVELQQNIGCLEEQAQKVANELRMVLSPDTSKDASPPPTVSTEVPLAQEIHACAYRVHSLRVLLDDLQSRIEL
jgi:hypothetical protein